MAQYLNNLLTTVIINLLFFKNISNTVIINKSHDEWKNVTDTYLRQSSTDNLNSTAIVSTTIATTTETNERACKCGGGLCSCCSKLLYDRWKQKACVEVTYDPDEFSFTAKIMFNDRVLYTRSVSGKNPRPICVPLPRIPLVRACVRFYNIYFQGRNVHMCVSMEGKFDDTTLVKVKLAMFLLINVR
ncbi:uncharacterized protein LOC130666410 [Microplitis mediator]|uniref:uncharacterized protein LOC130666410 n=1 Tax=Microplitis mediator TaxID=375433 RepID=UPI00255738BD|nr:uncharacterized protein LOC130666410 [Microplitis mediator]